MDVAKQRLSTLATGMPTVDNTAINTFAGTVYPNGTLAVLEERNARIKDKHIEVELRESEGETWVRITVAPTKLALAIFAVLLALAGTALMLQSKPLAYAIPLLVFCVYVHFLGYADLRQRIGKLIDPLYFNSPEAIAVAHQKILSLATITNNAFLWVSIITIIGVMAWAVLTIF